MLRRLPSATVTIYINILCKRSNSTYISSLECLGDSKIYCGRAGALRAQLVVGGQQQLNVIALKWLVKNADGSLYCEPLSPTPSDVTCNKHMIAITDLSCNKQQGKKEAFKIIKPHTLQNAKFETHHISNYALPTLSAICLQTLDI